MEKVQRIQLNVKVSSKQKESGKKLKCGHVMGYKKIKIIVNWKNLNWISQFYFYGLIH